MGKILSIVVITMNRSQQLIEALDSCMMCLLPKETEFIIINNASTDNTEDLIKNYMNKHLEYDFVYEKENENLGVGGGRSKGFEIARGEFLYFLDDDAIIDSECKNDFFCKSIDYLKRNELVASLTTKIYDEMLGHDRNVSVTSRSIDGLNCIFKYLGGSHFLRKSAFSTPLYFDISYGSEEYAPSIMAQDAGFFHVFDPSSRVIHKPKVNKWINGTDHMRFNQIRGAAVTYATKRILYPCLFTPVLWLGYTRRSHLYLKEYPGADKEAKDLARELIDSNKMKKIRVSTVLKMFMKFGLTVF